MNASGGFRPVGALPDPVLWRAALVLARDGEGRVLMQLRDDRPGIAAPGLWCLFGGGVERGEGPRDAALREFAEETGIALSAEELTPGFCLASLYHPNGLLHVFLCARLLELAAPRLGEGAGFAFLTPEQIARYDVVANLRAPLLEVLADS